MIESICKIPFPNHRYDLGMPIYVNMVRDPVERVISWYYYVRAPWYFVERKRAFPDLPLPNPNWLRKDYDTCVRRGDKECQYIEGWSIGKIKLMTNISIKLFKGMREMILDNLQSSFVDKKMSARKFWNINIRFCM